MSDDIPGSFRSLQVQRILSQILCTPYRDPLQPIAAGNFGYIDSYNQLVIPQTNVGTYINFPRAIENYEYIEITIQGLNPRIIVFGTTELWESTLGSASSDGGQQTIRIPNVGRITSIEFLQPGPYTVLDISVARGVSPYWQQEQNFDIFGIVPAGGISFDASSGTISKEIAPSATETFRLNPNLVADVWTGLLKMWISAATPFPQQQITFFDGVYTQLIQMLGVQSLYFDTNDDSVFLTFTNVASVPLTINFQPLVNFWVPASTTYGADPDEASSVVADWYVDSVGGSDSNAGDSQLFPFQTLAAAIAVLDDSQRVALKCGSLFREEWNQRTGKTGVSLVSYGSGRKPIISAFNVVAAGAITYVPGNTFLRLVNTFSAADYSGKTMFFEGDQQMVSTGAVDTGVPGTYLLESAVGLAKTYKIYPFSSDNGALGATYAAANRKYEIAHRGMSVGMNDNSRLEGIHCIGGILGAGSVVMGINSVVASCWIERFQGVGCCQHSGSFVGNYLSGGTKNNNENLLGYVFFYASQRGNMAPYDITAVDAMWNFNTLEVSGNELNTQLPSDSMDLRDQRGIYLIGVQNNTTISFNCFVNLKTPMECEDTSTGAGLSFERNYVRNWTVGIIANGPYLNCHNNWFNLDVQDSSFFMRNLIKQTGAGSSLNFYQNLVASTHDAANATIEATDGLLLNIHNNAFWMWNPGNGTAAPLLKVSVALGLAFNHNYVLACERVLLVPGATVPTIPAGAAWDYNAYGQITKYLAMFSINGVTEPDVATWKIPGAFDQHSTVGSFQTSRALLGDLTPDSLVAGVGPDSFDLSTFLQPMSLAALYDL